METRFFFAQNWNSSPFAANQRRQSVIKLNGETRKADKLEDFTGPSSFFLNILHCLPQPTLVKLDPPRCQKQHGRDAQKSLDVFKHLDLGVKLLWGSKETQSTCGLGEVGTPKSNSPLFRHLQLRLLYCLDGSRFSKQPTLESKGNKRTIHASKRQISPLMNLLKKIPPPLSWAIFVRLG